MDLLGIILTLLMGGPWLLCGTLLGLAGAWAAWTYMPVNADRAAIGAIILIAGMVLGGAMNAAKIRRK